jgi:hypothetical protein
VRNELGDDFIPLIWYVWGSYATAQTQARTDFYGVWYVPDARFDGYDRGVPSQYASTAEAHLEDPSPLSIEAHFVQSDDTTGTLFVHIDVTDTITTTNNLVHFVICEDGVDQMPNLARLMLLDGQLDVVAPGETADFEREYTLDESWDTNSVEFVVIAQSHGPEKRVLQAARALQVWGMAVAPKEGFVSQGEPGGPYTPSGATFAVKNTGMEPVEYSVSHREPWLSVRGESGTLPTGGTADVRVELNELASFLSEGYYVDVITFENVTAHIGNDTRLVSLRVGDPGLSDAYSIDFEDDPGWHAGLNWWRGTPFGSGGENGYPDPTSAHEGENIFAYNINGDYENKIPARHLTTSAYDCSEFAGTKLRFWRWLGVDDPIYDRASVHVSSDLYNWTTVWNNSGVVADSAWTLVEYDISAVADGCSTVYVRWTMGPTNYAERYCGWNIDDVEIWAARTTQNVSFGFPSFSSYPNPAGPTATFLYELEEAGHARLAIYDVSGRLVRVIHDGPAGAGWRVAEWDGRNEQGVPVAPGVYFSRLEAGQRSDTRKVALLR